VADGPREPGQIGMNPADADEAEPPLRHPFRQFFARHRTLDLSYRVMVALLGAAVVVGGIALIPLPGPGWLIVFGGLAILSTEFEWAGRLLDFARRKVLGWTHWVGRQSLLVRGLIGLVGLLFVAGFAWAYVATRGVPTWLPFS
jgi:uncharacterized protein (TIGR02611 family)